MSHRPQALMQFLTANGWGAAERTPIPRDASFRSYERLTLGNKRAIVMDAPLESPAGKEDVRPFIEIDRYLCEHGFSAPEIYAEDAAQGFLLLEDLGTDVYGAYLARHISDEAMLYKAATEVLAALHRCEPIAHLPRHDEAMLAQEAMLFLDWYVPYATNTPITEALRQEYLAIWQPLLAMIQALPNVMVLRDYHSPNLLWLPSREDVRKVGIIDFQDAVIGSPAYDVVSLLEDARRDIDEALSRQLLEHYLYLMPELDRELLISAYAILGVQRNIRILGVFVRKLFRDDSANYLPMLPRLWRYMERGLAHPVMQPLKTWLERVAPAAARPHEQQLLQQRYQERKRA